ncbi:MAG: hypothetical protein IKR19_08090 [Acholeplasmatales bacterium]|nr:hypothetical protein [Acholeplasmatales bacterium]
MSLVESNALLVIDIDDTDTLRIIDIDKFLYINYRGDELEATVADGDHCYVITVLSHRDIPEYVSFFSDSDNEEKVWRTVITITEDKKAIIIKDIMKLIIGYILNDTDENTFIIDNDIISKIVANHLVKNPDGEYDWVDEPVSDENHCEGCDNCVIN